MTSKKEQKDGNVIESRNKFPNKRNSSPFRAPVFDQPQQDTKLMNAGGISLSEGMASFSAAVFSHAELAKHRDFEDIRARAENMVRSQRPRSKSEACDGTSTSSMVPKKRKAASVVSLVSLDRSSEEGSTVSAVASGEPDEIPFLSGCVDSSGLMRLSFPMKLHWMLYECEKTRKAQKRTEDEKSNKKQKTSPRTKEDAGIIIGWLNGGRAFKIFDEDRFIKEIMPNYFVGTFKDFKRDLEMW
eukprot:CAMPEP_0116101694 /NCGR_PEP_ID=MMETSP0327-20121206/12946_1 /TAXON_ID=44447 /ORGANISM="Pseudo-nitzschia delicatissima, Strain B596" /LENGTH=242 /DNA_ID=CAMNT_0003593671 /DNA_START=40 /DNA_END=765 /DNA_ORIENTATION=+